MINGKHTLAFVLALAAACAPAVIPLDRAEMARLRGEQIQVATYPPPRFLYQAPSAYFGPGSTGVFNPMGGGFGGMAGDPRSQIFAISSPLEDPAMRVKDVFIMGLADQLEGARISQTPEVVADDDLPTLQKKFGGGVVLDFKTETWGLLTGSMPTLPYQMVYAARARLVRLGDGRVLWRGQCQYDGRDARANLDQFAIGSAPVLQEKFAFAAESCAKTLLSQFSKQ